MKKLSNLNTQAGKTTRSVLLLERLRWSYLQPKLQLLRSNLDRLKSTLLLMLNVVPMPAKEREKCVSFATSKPI